jgi:cell division protein FtsQ
VNSDDASTDDTPTPGTRRARWGRRVAAVGVLLLVASPWWSRPLLRRMDFFLVRHVEVRGARYTAPSELAASLRIDSTFSIWNDLTPLDSLVRAHPQIADARVTRRLPATLVVTVDEYEPVALVPAASGFRPHDASGRALPFDPSRTPVDLPIVPRRDTTLLRLLGEIRAADPALFARVSEMRRAGRRDVLMVLVTVPVRLPDDVAMERLAQISSVENDLARRRARVVELDLRFRDQVIARIQ